MGAGFPAVASAPDGADAHVGRESVAGGESSQNHQLCPRPDSRRALIIRFCPLADADLKSAQQSMHLLLARGEQT